MKFKVKSKECLLTIQIKTSFGESVDEQLLDSFSRVYLRGFLKPKTIKKNQIEYTGPIGINLQERLKKPISKRDFLFLIEHIVVAFQKLQAAKFPLEHLLTDLENIYVNENTKELHFLYVPMSKTKKENDVWSIFNTIIYSAKPMQEKDTEYISRFHYFLAGTPHDLERIESFVMKEDRSVVNTIKKHTAGQSGFMTIDYGHHIEHYQNFEDDDEKTGLLDDEQTGLLYEECEDTALLVEEDLDYESEETGLLVEDEVEEVPHFPTLERILTGEKISVNKAVFRLGKEKSYVDYFVSNNDKVSRSHADIINRGKSYFIKDLNSKNHTYINGQRIPIQVETELFDGDKVRLANEEFMFYI